MLFQGKKVLFPAVTKISFFKVIENLRNQAKDPDKNVSRYAKSLLVECAKYPELEEGFEDRKLLEKHRPIINRLARVLFPQVLLTNEIKGLIPPFDFVPFHVSSRFEKIMENAGGDYQFKMEGFDEDLIYIYGATAILEVHYGYKIASSGPTSIDIEDKKHNTTRSYRLAYNADLTEMVPTEKAPKITDKDYRELMDDYYNIDLWKEKFPPDSYIMRGVGMVNLMDITQDRSLSTITASLLTKTPESFDRIMESMRNLFGIPDLLGGFVEMKNNSFVAGTQPHKKGMDSFILDGDENLPCENSLCDLSYTKILINHEPLVVTDTDHFDKVSNSNLSDKLKKNKKIGSFILAPLIFNDEMVGFMELVSPRKYDLNGSSVAPLRQLLPIFAMAIARFKRESENTREAIIQQECTTIHASVKWRFDEEADRYMRAQYRKEQPDFQDIVFKDVYPLYGQLDIKGSSEKRNEAIKGDLLKQMKGIRRVLSGALKKTGMPVYEGLIFTLESYRDEIHAGMSSGSEQKIQSFMSAEIEPVLNHLEKQGEDMAKLVSTYRGLLDQEHNTVYELRKQFDTSVNVINQTLASLLDEKQIEAQRMFPHYFERYKTDGVEYNMYIGQSIANNKEFDPVYLDNLRLWQLLVTCELENRFEELKKELDTPLEVASLILAYSTPLAVHFRTDEKRFDVEGAYNARYEIVKKRVDKAHIKGTNERITVPGKIAIIYNNDKDSLEYEKYLEFLQAKGHIKKGSVEHLKLEDLQGITGLKALRAEVNYHNQTAENDFSIDQLLAGIKGN